MQIVIDIPEELKNKIDNANEDNYKTCLWWFETTLYCAIKDGTPLPEGHGRLYDEKAIRKEIENPYQCVTVLDGLKLVKPILEKESEE